VTLPATGGAETVNTTSGELAFTVDSDQVKDIALNGRNYLELVTLMPGVAVLNLDQMATTTSFGTNYQSINGGRVEGNHLAVDGTSNLDSGSNTSQLNNVSVDAIQQVRMQTSAFSAEYGRNSGATINVNQEWRRPLPRVRLLHQP
jgi:TonB-dependent Receptor Plug Domain